MSDEANACPECGRRIAIYKGHPVVCQCTRTTPTDEYKKLAEIEAVVLRVKLQLLRGYTYPSEGQWRDDLEDLAAALRSSVGMVKRRDEITSGGHLGVVRDWIKCHFRNGEHVIWGSTTPLISHSLCAWDLDHLAERIKQAVDVERELREAHVERLRNKNVRLEIAVHSAEAAEARVATLERERDEARQAIEECRGREMALVLSVERFLLDLESPDPRVARGACWDSLVPVRRAIRDCRAQTRGGE